MEITPNQANDDQCRKQLQPADSLQLFLTVLALKLPGHDFNVSHWLVREKIVGNRDAACQQLEETVDLARNLGDDLSASQAERRLAELKAVAPKFRAAEPKKDSVVGGQFRH